MHFLARQLISCGSDWFSWFKGAETGFSLIVFPQLRRDQTGSRTEAPLAWRCRGLRVNYRGKLPS